MLPIIKILHPIVDFCSVAVLAAGGITFERWLELVQSVIPNSAILRLYG